VMTKVPGCSNVFLGFIEIAFAELNPA